MFQIFSIIRLAILLALWFACLNNRNFCEARKHRLFLYKDIRRFFPISTFGYFTGGILEVTVNGFHYYPIDLDHDIVSNEFGFTLARTLSNNISPYIEGQYSQQACVLNQPIDYFSTPSLGLMMMKFDFKKKKVFLQCNTQMNKLAIYPSTGKWTRFRRSSKNILSVSSNNQSLANQKEIAQSNLQNGISLPTNPQSYTPMLNEEKDKVPLEEQSVEPKEEFKESIVSAVKKKQDDGTSFEHDVDPFNRTENSCFIDSVPMDYHLLQVDNVHGFEYTFKFQVVITEPHDEGLYALYFHNCLNYAIKVQELKQYVSIGLDINIVEKNLRNYLSAGEIPLPQLYFALSIIFFVLGIIWFLSLRNKSSEIFKIHYLMGVLVCVKALSLLFHGINYYYIAKEGTQVETWAILYYVTHFLKGALMFITIILIGTGWAFIKHILSDKDKKIFIIMIPLQVLANIADIVTEESEEGALIHTVWREIFILVDMVCCGAILFPVIWSIKHLQEASATDGKAAINLKKLQLFRFFYVMIVVYIYFTRIIVYLLKITVPFNYEWLDAFFQHAATLIFFILTGYHFQPSFSNPYHQLLQEDIEMDEEVLFIQPNTFSEAKKRNRDLESSGDNLINQHLINSQNYD